MAKKCKAKTAKGDRCKRPACGDHGLCPTHVAKRDGGNAGGRPRREAEQVYAKAFETLGDPPEHPIDLFLWCQRASAIALKLTVTGKGDERMNAQIRSLTASVRSGLPVEQIVKRVANLSSQPAKPRASSEHEVLTADEAGAPVGSGSLRG